MMDSMTLTTTQASRVSRYMMNSALTLKRFVMMAARPRRRNSQHNLRVAHR